MDDNSESQLMDNNSESQVIDNNSESQLIDNNSESKLMVFLPRGLDFIGQCHEIFTQKFFHTELSHPGP